MFEPVLPDFALCRGAASFPLSRLDPSAAGFQMLLVVAYITHGSLLHENRNYGVSSTTLQKALDICRKLGLRRPGVAVHATECLRLQSHNHRSLGMRLDAQRTAQEAVYLADAAVQEETQLGKDQCSRCRNALAHAYLDLGQAGKSLELWEQVPAWGLPSINPIGF